MLLTIKKCQLLFLGLPRIRSPDVERVAQEHQAAEHGEARGRDFIGHLQVGRRLPRNDRDANHRRGHRSDGDPQLHSPLEGREESSHHGPHVHSSGQNCLDQSPRTKACRISQRSCHFLWNVHG